MLDKTVNWCESSFAKHWKSILSAPVQKLATLRAEKASWLDLRFWIFIAGLFKYFGVALIIVHLGYIHFEQICYLVIATSCDIIPGYIKKNDRIGRTFHQLVAHVQTSST